MSAKSPLASLRIIPELCLRINGRDTRNDIQKVINLLSELKNPVSVHLYGVLLFYRPKQTNYGRG